MYEKGPELIVNRQLIWSVGPQSLLSAIHDGLDNVTKGPLVGLTASGILSTRTVPMRRTSPASLMGTFVIRQWGPRFVPDHRRVQPGRAAPLVQEQAVPLRQGGVRRARF